MTLDTFPDFRNPANTSLQEHSKIILADLKANLNVALEHRRKLPVVALSRLYMSFESLVGKMNMTSQEESAPSLRQIKGQCDNILAKLHQVSRTGDCLLQVAHPQLRRRLPFGDSGVPSWPSPEVKREEDENMAGVRQRADDIVRTPHAVRHPSILVHEQAFVGASMTALSEASASSVASSAAADVAEAASSDLPSPTRRALTCQASARIADAHLVARRNRGVAHAHCIVRKLQKMQASRPSVSAQAQLVLAEQELARREQLLRYAQSGPLGRPTRGRRISRRR